jgi:hypothetical protein
MGGRSIAQQLYPEEYHVWQDMKTRCLNPKYHQYYYYGGRGITIDPKWMNITGFIEDMGHRPSSKHTLDRKDNDKGYNKENCHWATESQQMHNRRDNVLNETDVSDIRRLYGARVYNQKELGELYGVRSDYISAIIRHVIWR